ncbi:hypothetical protein Mal15_47110 [Stieleria maiorica]|uniref:Uncharacterized protein n=1 Tax=Stieleria maiorica TaxID=2795974 RepID=A0A5B9MJM1_9BACT|nr:hypothetical protein [Stieleria maiorica]QEG00640.1 hypothetical protein Mal15_47110 [Stieleria maiorica]
MRAVIGIAVLMLVLAWVGWVQFSSPDGDPTIRVDSDKVRQDTAEIVEKSKQVVDRAAESVDENLETEPEPVAEPEAVDP